jgi:hypothetical protein
MSLAIARWGLETALLLAVGLGLFAGVWRLAERLGGGQAARAWVRAGHGLLVAALLLPLALRLWAPQPGMLPAPMRVWSDARGGGIEVRMAQAPLAPGQLGASAAAPSVGDRVITLLALGLLAGGLLGLAHLVRDAIRLRRLCQRAVPFRQVGRVSICACEQARVPFSAWTGGRAYVVLPVEFLLDPARLRLAVAHELEHIRARDTGWVYLPALGRALFPWHPAAHAWMRCLSRLQEMACDERLAARRGISARAYGGCLLWAAELAAGSRPAPLGVVPMLAPDGSGSFLARRIRRLLSGPRPTGKSALPAGLSVLAVLGGLALLAHGAIADERLSLAQARALAARVEHNAGLRITVDETVLAALNNLAGSAEGRASFAQGLERMTRYQPLIQAAFQRHGIPRALLAIPQMESRFQALPEGNNPSHSAGIWQFVPGTARRFGLQVGGGVDERLDPAREAEAAAAYLAQMYAEFDDWPLVIAGYNNGAPRVRRALESEGTRDAGILVRRRAVSPYVSRVLATAILMQAPELLH